MTCYFAPAFYCGRIGNATNGKIKPLLVKFVHEQDMQNEWPHISITQDCTKQQHKEFRKCYAELHKRQSDGERVIMI